MTGLQWGAYDERYPTQLSGFNALIPIVGRDVKIVHWYVQWSGHTGGEAGYKWADNAGTVKAQHAADKIPMITWEPWNEYAGRDGTNPFPLSSIAAGTHDKYLDEWAKGVASVSPGLVYIRLFHEPNITYYPGGYPWTIAEGQFHNDPATYVAAWRRVHDRFAAAGATNVRWVLNPAGDLTWNPFPAAAYPGDGYVDFVGFDAYSGAPAGSVAKDYAIVTALSATKPVLLGEVSGNPTWVKNEIGGIAKLPGSRLQAIVWFNEGSFSVASTGSGPALKTLFGP